RCRSTATVRCWPTGKCCRRPAPSIAPCASTHATWPSWCRPSGWMFARSRCRPEYRHRPWPGPSIAVGRAGLVHQGVVLLEDLHHPGAARAGLGDLVPEFLRLHLHRLPFLGGDGGQLQLATFHPQLGLATPVPVLAV